VILGSTRRGLELDVRARSIAGRERDWSRSHRGARCTRAGASATSTTLSIIRGATWNKNRVVAAMKGYISEQKARGSIQSIHDRLMAWGIENYTMLLEPHGANLYLLKTS
jgi:hypothetical protein